MPAERYARQYPNTAQGRYLAMLEQVDAAIKQVLDALESSTGNRDTIVVITSDNGGTSRYFPSNAPFPGSKGQYLEGGLRTPLLLHWKGRWEGGEKIERPVSIIDIAPTLLRAAGLEASETMRGRDLFRDTKARPLYWYQHALGLWQASMLSADGDWRLIQSSREAELLLHRDDFQTDGVNRREAEPARAQQMGDKLQAWVREVTRVELNTSAGEDDRWLHLGDDFRRTPAIGSYTIGVPIIAQGTLPGIVLEQSGYLQLAVNATSELELDFDSYRTKLALPDDLRGCHSLAITAFLIKQRGRISHKKGDSQLSVFLDGEEIHTATFRDQSYSTSPPSTPLLTHARPSSRLHVPAGVPPVISTRRMDAAEVRDRLHYELLDACSSSTE